MDTAAFFKALAHQFQKQLPFVAYRKPNGKQVKALLQTNDTVYYADDYSESGFVMAPFDGSEKAVLMPLSECQNMTLEEFVMSTERSDEKSHQTQRNPKELSLQNSTGKEQHINLVQKGIEAIKEGHLKKVVLSRIEPIDLSDANPLDVLKRLLARYSSAFVYCWYHPKVGLWLGATPETLLTLQGNQFTTMALAGTQAYEGSLDVVWGDKEQEEQKIVTDFIVNNLQSVIDRTKLKVSEVKTVRAGSLLHLKTEISGTLNTTNFELKLLLSALHPTPAVCGFPRGTAKNFILKHESYHREFYTGFLGEINVNQTSNLFVNLRCMQWQDSQVLIYVGGGITKDSNPESEWQETVNKSQTMTAILQ